VETGEPPAGRPSGPERRNAARETLVAARLPAGEAFCLPRQVVEGGGERGQALDETCRADEIVRRWQLRHGKGLSDAGQHDARDGMRRYGAAAVPFRTCQGVEKQQAYRPPTGRNRRAPCRRGGTPCLGGGTGHLSRRHPYGDAETAQELLRRHGLRLTLARGWER